MGSYPAVEETVKVFQKYSDQELIEECLAGDAQCWEILIERYRALIYSIPLKYGISESDAADIFQNCCVTILEKLAELRDKERFSSWLFTTVVRQCWRLRQRQRREPVITSFIDDEDDDLKWELAAADLPIDERLLKLENHFLVHTAFDQLSERCRVLLGYLFFADPPPSYKEIADHTGIHFDSIGPTRTRCLEKFKLLFHRAQRGVFTAEE